MSNVRDETTPEGAEVQAEAAVQETATGGLGALAAAVSTVVTTGEEEALAAPGGSQNGPAPEGGRKFATVEEAGAQSPAAARAFMRGDKEAWRDADALQAREQEWESTTFLTELLKGKDGVTRVEEGACSAPASSHTSASP